jgi:hypothetical protein
VQVGYSMTNEQQLPYKYHPDCKEPTSGWLQLMFVKLAANTYGLQQPRHMHSHPGDFTTLEGVLIMIAKANPCNMRCKRIA